LTGGNNTPSIREELGLGNVTNESKATMFDAPTITGDVVFSGTDAAGNSISNRTYAGLDSFNSEVAFNNSVQFSNSGFTSGTTNTAINFPTNEHIAFRTSDTERMRITSAGRVGIGASPSNGTRLHVVGKILSTEGLIDRSPAAHLVPGDFSPAGIFFNSPNSTDSPAMVYRAGYHQFTDNDNSPDDVFIVDFRQDSSLSARGGRVGIGTLTPNDKLQVVEKGAGQVATFHSQKNEKTDESPSFTALIDIIAGTTGSGDFPAIGRLEQRRQVTDSILANGIKYNNSFHVVGDRFGRAYDRFYGKVKLKPLNITAVTAVYDSPNVRFGVGDDSPTNTLHISGSGSIAQNKNNFANATMRITNSPNNLYLDSNEVVSDNDLYLLSTKNSGFISFAAYDSPAVDARVNIMNASAAGVAIGQGTTVADEKLHVVGNAKVVGNVKVDGTITSAASAPNLTLKDTDGTDQITAVFNSAGVSVIQARNNTTNGIIDFRQNNGTTVTTPMRIDSSGNVGIGATSAGEKLEVTGNIKGSGTITSTSSTKRPVQSDESDDSPIRNIRKVTQAQYDALTPDANTLYVIV
jgi:hypothetical protein